MERSVLRVRLWQSSVPDSQSPAIQRHPCPATRRQREIGYFVSGSLRSDCHEHLALHDRLTAISFANRETCTQLIARPLLSGKWMTMLDRTRSSRGWHEFPESRHVALLHAPRSPVSASFRKLRASKSVDLPEPLAPTKSPWTATPVNAGVAKQAVVLQFDRLDQHPVLSQLGAPPSAAPMDCATH